MKRPSHTLVVYASNLLITTKGSIPRTAVSSVKFLNIKGPSILSLERFFVVPHPAFHLCTFHSLKRGGESDRSQSRGPPGRLLPPGPAVQLSTSSSSLGYSTSLALPSPGDLENQSF